MTIVQEPLSSGERHAERRWHRFGRGAQTVRYTEAWEHETFAEEQARWERSDLEYARICEAVREANERGGEGSRRADQAKAEWDARVATQREANDDAQRADHALKAEQTGRRRPATSRTAIRAREAHRNIHPTFAIESNDSPAPGIIPEPVRVHDEPAATTAPRGERQAARLRFRGPGTRTPLSNEPIKLEVV